MSQMCEGCQRVNEAYDKIFNAGKNVAEILDEILAASERNPFTLSIPSRLARMGNRVLEEWEKAKQYEPVK